jgi:hypothetical protein
VCGLDSGNAAFFVFRQLDQLHGTSPVIPTDVQVVAYQVKEWLAGCEIPRAPERVSIPKRLRLLNELKYAAMVRDGLQVRRLVSGPHHDTDLLDASPKDLIDQNCEYSTAHAVTIHKRLQRQTPLPFTGSGDYCFLYSHGCLQRL